MEPTTPLMGTALGNFFDKCVYFDSCFDSYYSGKFYISKRHTMLEAAKL